MNPEFVAWLSAVIALGLTTWAAGLRFSARHSRRYGLFMSFTQRFDLFVSHPREWLRRAIPDSTAQSRALWTPADDPGVEGLRRLTLGLAALTAAVAAIGLPAWLVALGIVRRLPSIEADEWAIVLFWAVLLCIAAVRRGSRLTLAFLGVALVASAVIGYVSGLR